MESPETLTGVMAAALTGMAGLLGWLIRRTFTWMEARIERADERQRQRDEDHATALRATESVIKDIARTVGELHQENRARHQEILNELRRGH